VTRGFRLPLRRVLVPVDLSDTSRGALVVALSWSSALRGDRETSKSPERTRPTKLTAMYVDDPARVATATPSAEEALTEELDRVRKKAGTWAGVAIAGVAIARADVPGAIADRARDDDADLIVLGTRGLGLDGVGRLGSVSAEVTRRVDAPVLLVPPAIWMELRRHA
jgi:nucleotide-binding universal stress UspA family protein